MNKIKADGINSQGFGTIAKSVMTDQRLTVTSKAIYAYFCSYAGAGEQCFPSRSKICYDLKITENTYTKHLRILIDCGYISVEQQRENGKFARNIYILNNSLPCRKKPCRKNTVSQKMVYENLHTINNNNKNNNNIINNSCCNCGGEKEQFENLYMPEDYTEGEIQDFNDYKKMVRCGTHGCVLLNGDQQEKLLDILSLDEFDYYIEKLDNFIYNKNAKVKNHYLTIKRWVNKDRNI